jgi:hypothetical protein
MLNQGNEFDCRLKSQRKCRLKRKCEDDDVGEFRTYSPTSTTHKKKKLRVPTSQEQSERLRAAIEKKGNDAGWKPHQIRRELLERRHVYDRRDAQMLHATNPFAGGKWARMLEEAITSRQLNKEMWAVTIIHDSWCLGTYPVLPSPEELADVLRRMWKAIWSRMRGTPYLLQADIAVRRHVHDHRVYVEVHCHGLVWADGGTINLLKQKFPPNKFGAEGMKKKPVRSLLGWLDYLVKDSRLNYLTVENRGFAPGGSSKGWFHYREPQPRRTRQLLMHMVGDLTKPELCSASGEGREVLQEAKRLARAKGWRPSPRVSRESSDAEVEDALDGWEAA